MFGAFYFGQPYFGQVEASTPTAYTQNLNEMVTLSLVFFPLLNGKSPLWISSKKTIGSWTKDIKSSVDSWIKEAKP